MSEVTYSKNKYLILGVMSGTSVDGLDMALVEFRKGVAKWQFKVIHAQTSPYPTEWEERLKEAIFSSEENVQTLDSGYATYISGLINNFIKEKPQPDLIASHGHTIFHQPDKGITVQIGNGDVISSNTGLPVVWDFRSLDVSLGGQGAPLVPVGDRDLFPDYDFCLNLGGIANISYQHAGERIAFDICPINMALNPLAQQLGKPFDKGGELARSGNINENLLTQLNEIPYCKETPPKSLGLEDYQQHWQPIIASNVCSIADKLRTTVEHVAIQVGKVINSIEPNGSVMVAGGGALNTFFIERLRANTQAKVIIPEREIIEFKEAIVFAYLALLRINGQPNCLASVTGAQRDNSGGKLSGF